MKFDKIDAVLKITERCNINCTYCYMFNKGSDLYQSKPKQMPTAVCEAVAAFLAKGAAEVGATVIRPIFHGGEPTMMRLSAFDQLCAAIKRHAEGIADVQFSIQTNAMLIEEQWIDLFQKYQIGPGVSLDGDRRLNDKHRLDHAGRGTYDRTILGVNRLFEAHQEGRIPPPSVLCVIDPTQDGGQIFHHFATEVGFKWMDFLLPIDTRKNISRDTAIGVGRYLEKVFNAWSAHGDRTITIRFFDQYYSFLTGWNRTHNQAMRKSHGTVIITIASDGTYGPDDTLRIVSDDYFEFDCQRNPLSEYLMHPMIRQVETANKSVPAECKDCPWASYCLGGANNGRLVNRYSDETGYDQKSGLCEGLMHIYSVLAQSLIKAGYPRQLMFERFERGVSERVAAL